MMVMTLPVALPRPAGPVAARRDVQLCRPDHRRLGAVGRSSRSSAASSCSRARCCSSGTCSSSTARARPSPRRLEPLYARRRAPAAARAGGAQRLRALERAGARADGRSPTAIRSRSSSSSMPPQAHRAPRRRAGLSHEAGRTPTTSTDPGASGRASSIISVLAFSVALRLRDPADRAGPGRGHRRLHGDLPRASASAPGSPAAPQPTSERQGASPTTQVAWSTRPDAAPRSPAGRVRRRGRPRLRRPATANAASRADPQNPEPCRPVRRGDLQAASRLQERQAARTRSWRRIAQGLEDAADRRRGGPFRRPRPALPSTRRPREVVDPDIIRLVERGDPARGLPACNSCHGVQCRRSDRDPDPVASEPGISRCAAAAPSRAASRRNDIYTRMRSVASKLTDREIDRLATFYATTLSY